MQQFWAPPLEAHAVLVKIAAKKRAEMEAADPNNWLLAFMLPEEMAAVEAADGDTEEEKRRWEMDRLGWDDADEFGLA